MSSKPKSRTLDRDRNRSLRKRAWFDDRAGLDHVTDRANAPRPAVTRPGRPLALVVADWRGARS